MKFLNVVDLVYQTFILGIVALLSAISVLTGGLETAGMFALYGAVFIGPWQLVSSILTTIARGLYFKLRVIHLVGSAVYIGGFAIGASLSNGESNAEWVESIGGFVGFLIPAALAVFYYYITIKSFQLSRAKPN